MVIKQLKDDKNFVCGYRQATDGVLGICGEHAVTITNKIPLCMEHTKWFISMQNCTLKNNKNAEINETDRFISILDAPGNP